ncbi:hypothetical protein L1987_18807 [Smallanthus sonchifolius]|uniref:Uncharacterized protein n=1 Tax=Smallanthus sonchifolius TaxID=185202 RepID=A0ACB9J188_9ASTR|nr:hypothetical protein L1987_18807 [Smallanthus sonchifolius]
MNVALLKRTKDLNAIPLNDLISIIKSYDLDDQQRKVNHVNTLNSAGGQGSNSAFLSSVSKRASGSGEAVTGQSTVAKSTVPDQQAYSAQHAKLIEANTSLCIGIMNCYVAFASGNLSPLEILTTELNQIHPEDVEELDISWQLVMAIFRAKNFINKTEKFRWSEDTGKKIGFNKSNLRCYNCHEQGHFTRECTKPKEQRVSDAGQAVGDKVVDNSKALISQQTGGYDWGDQLKDLNLNHAFMADIIEWSSSTSSSATPPEVTANLCSKLCIYKVELYRKHNADLIFEIENLKYHKTKFSKTEKAIKEVIEANKKDISLLKSQLSEKCCVLTDAKQEITKLTTEL